MSECTKEASPGPPPPVPISKAEVEPCSRKSVSPALRSAHEGLGEVDADVLADEGADELEKDPVAAPEVGHDLPAGQPEERQHAPHPLDRVRVVLVHIALIVDRAQLLFGETVRRPPDRHVMVGTWSFSLLTADC